MNKDYSKQKIVMRIIGIPLLVIGIILAILGFTIFTSGSFDQAFGKIIMIAVGSILIVIGFGLVILTLIRPISKYYATETSPAITTASHAVGKGLKESGAFDQNTSKKIIKVKCPHCGYLDSEDAEFCSKCGKKI